MPYPISIASHKHFQGIAALHFLSHTQSFRDFADLSWVENRDLERYLKFWDTYLAAQEDRDRTWISLDGERVIGTITIMARENCSEIFLPSDITDPANQDLACLRLMYIDPGYFRQGIGSRLVDLAQRFMEEEGYQRGVLITHAANRKARSFYEKMGWVLDSLIDEQVPEFFQEPPLMRSRARYQKWV